MPDPRDPDQPDAIVDARDQHALVASATGLPLDVAERLVDAHHVYLNDQLQGAVVPIIDEAHEVEHLTRLLSLDAAVVATALEALNQDLENRGLVQHLPPDDHEISFTPTTSSSPSPVSSPTSARRSTVITLVLLAVSLVLVLYVLLPVLMD
jgi:hypothetical protein